MEKIQLLEKYGESKIKDIAGILHNYTKNDSLEDHENLEYTIQKWYNKKLKDALPNIESELYF